MSFATYYMHLIFGKIPSLMSSDSIIYILPALTISILFFSKITKNLIIILFTEALNFFSLDNRLFSENQSNRNCIGNVLSRIIKKFSIRNWEWQQ